MKTQIGIARISRLILLVGSVLGGGDLLWGLSPEEEGRGLISDLRQQRPSHGLTNQATLKIRDGDGRRRSIPISVRIVPEGNSWQVVYQSVSKGNSVSLTIHHREDRPPDYELTTPATAEGAAAPRRRLAAGESSQSFAGTDFWICDLGLEFLHWPEHRLIRSEPHSGVMCRVVESRNPTGLGYARVLSWIEPEHRALLGAEAFDAKGRLLKRFSVASVSKEGIREMRMRNLGADSLTELIYDDPAK